MALKCPNAVQLHTPEQQPMKLRQLNARGISARIWNVPAHLRHWRVWIR